MNDAEKTQAQLLREMAALRESESLYRSAFETATDAVFVADAESGKLIDANQRGRALLGRSLDEIRQMHFSEVHPPEDRERGRREFQEILRNPGRRFAELPVLHRDGTCTLVEIGASGPVRSGTRTLVFGVFRDITTRGRSRERLQQLNRLMERLILPGTLEVKLRLIVEAVVEVFAADFARVWIIRPGDLCDRGCLHAQAVEGPHVCRLRDRCLHLVASTGRYTHLDSGMHRRVPFGCYKIGRVAAGEDSGFITNEVTLDPRIHDHAWARELGLTAFAGYRLLSSAGAPIGVLALFSRQAIGPEEDSLLEGLASITSQVMQTAAAEEALRAKTEELDRYFASSRDLLCIADTGGFFRRLNAEWERTLGYPLAELEGKRFLDLVHPEDRTATLEAMSTLRDQKEVLNFSNRYRCRDGSFRWLEWRSFPAGNLIYAVARDISERQRIEQALLERDLRFNVMLRNSSDVITILQPDGTVSYQSPSLKRIFGYEPEELLGRNAFGFVHPDDLPSAQAAFAQGLEAPGRTVMAAYRFRHADGSWVDVESVGISCLDEPDIRGFLLNSRDIRERRQAEEEHRKLEAHLREVQKLESLGLLAGGIAHDFNNLLMAMLGNADLALLHLSPAAPARNHLEEIVRASQRASELCNQMLAYSGKGRFVIARHDLSEIVREMAQMLEVSISKKASLRYFYADRLPPVEADATQIRQVIMNLITNASDSLADRGGIISVATGITDCDSSYLSDCFLDDRLPEGRYVYLEVSDTGSGMDQETRQRIFDPFFTTKFTGRGLGLAAVLGIVRGHKGAIKVYSEPGKGTTFKVLLPSAAGAAEEQHRAAEAGRLRRSGGTVLIVDDDPDVRRVTEEMLTALGFRSLAAANGKEGLEILEKHGTEIACVILDLTMPEMGGEEAFRQIRALGANVRVILSSGYNEQDVTQRFVGRGLAGFIQKPYTLAKLREILGRVLG